MNCFLNRFVFNIFFEQAVLVRNNLRNKFENELEVLHRDDQLIANWLSSGEGKMTLSETAIGRLTQQQVAEEQKLKVAMNMRVMMAKDSSVSLQWATVLRDVLGETFTTEKEAREQNSTVYDQMLSIFHARRKRIKEELSDMKKFKYDKDSQSFKEKQLEYKKACEGAFVLTSKVFV